MERDKGIKRRAFIGISLLSTGSLLASPFSFYKNRTGFSNKAILQEGKVFASESSGVWERQHICPGFLDGERTGRGS